MAGALMIYYRCNPGKVVRWLDGEYTSTKRHIAHILCSVRPYISDPDFEYIKRILTQGCPASVNYEEDTASKVAMMKRGNQEHFFENADVVKQTINKEDRYSYSLPVVAFFCLFSPFLCHNAQGMIIKPGKNPRIVWDGSTKRTPMDVVINDITSTDNEAEVTFGMVKTLFYVYLYNLCISFPS